MAGAWGGLCRALTAWYSDREGWADLIARGMNQGLELDRAGAGLHRVVGGLHPASVPLNPNELWRLETQSLLLGCWSACTGDSMQGSGSKCARLCG